MATQPDPLELLALQKRVRGQQLSWRENRAFLRYEKSVEEERRWGFYARIPRRHWVKMSGRSPREVNAQARECQLPLTGATIDLPKVARAIHDLLAEKASSLSKRGNKSEPLAGDDPLQLLRLENARIRKLQRQELESQLLSADQVRAALDIFLGGLRATGKKLQKKCGAASAGILADTLASWEREIDSFFGEGYHAEAAPKTY